MAYSGSRLEAIENDYKVIVNDPSTNIASQTQFIQMANLAQRAIAKAGLWKKEAVISTILSQESYDLAALIGSPSTTSAWNAAPVMTANNVPASRVVALSDSAGADAAAGTNYAYKAMDNSVAADNGCRSNATPTALAPIYFTLDLGANQSAIFDAFDIVSWSNASADTRAYPAAFSFWGSNESAPAAQTDADWTQINKRGGTTWTAQTDPGTGTARRYYTDNATPYRHYRLKITDRCGTNAYVAMGELKLYAIIPNLVQPYSARWYDDDYLMQECQSWSHFREEADAWDGTTGTPLNYFIQTGKLYLAPAPDASTANAVYIWHSYVPTALDLTNNVTPEIPPGFDDAYTFKAAELYFRRTRDWDAAREYQGLAAMELVKLRSAMGNNQFASTPYR
jgi:hypothetical protein